ncbi:MAG: hypothetical protein HY361_02670 [Candidatus Aenigmarchaeota archaeon]|nr:hypothetical protein [Candidatus Aenigmarchaeota archaeon]
MNKREPYSKEALSQIPRLLSMLDRNEGSKTFGSFYRAYWHDKATDVINAHPQIGALALALVYKKSFPNNIFYNSDKIKKWAIAGMVFWANIQNSDGSFNEHYINEHSYGATAWTLSAMLEAYRLLKTDMPKHQAELVLAAIIKAAKWLTRNDDPGPLTNHQAIAAFSLNRVFTITKNKIFLEGMKEELDNILKNQSKEGWFFEYDGADLGYLTTTISFLAKLYNENKDPVIFESLEKAIMFSSYFIFPDGSFCGLLGSRNTSHFHPHGFELLAKYMPLAAAVKSKFLLGLSARKVLTPDKMDERYFSNLIVEFLQSYLDYSDYLGKASLPVEGKDFTKYFGHSGYYMTRTSNYYAIVNMKKGGVSKMFNFKNKKIIADSGIVGVYNGSLFTSQVQNSSVISMNGNNINIEGRCTTVPAYYLTPSRNIISRIFLLLFGGNTKLSNLIKKTLIRKVITKKRLVNVKFKRNFNFLRNKILIKDTIIGKNISKLSIEDIFYPRYVPSSRYFAEYELQNENLDFNKFLKSLNRRGEFLIKRQINF